MLVRRRGLRRRGSGRLKKGRRKITNSDVRRGRSHRFLSIKGVGCEGQEKIWTNVFGSLPQERQSGVTISPILSREEWKEGRFASSICRKEALGAREDRDWETMHFAMEGLDVVLYEFYVLPPR